MASPGRVPCSGKRDQRKGTIQDEGESQGGIICSLNLRVYAMKKSRPIMSSYFAKKMGDRCSHLLKYLQEGMEVQFKRWTEFV